MNPTILNALCYKYICVDSYIELCSFIETKHTKMKNSLFTFALLISFVSFGQTQLEYFEKGDSKYESGDYYGAIYEYTKAIKSGNFYPPAYTNRGLAKSKLGDYSEGLKDLNYVIDIVPEFILTYLYRGIIKAESKDYSGAIADFTKVIEKEETKSPSAYTNRGLAKYKLGDLNGACSDWKEAAKLGGKTAQAYIIKNCKVM